MESQPQNPEFRNNHENLHLCVSLKKSVCLFVLMLYNFSVMLG